MKKKLIAGVLMTCIVVSLCACKQKELSPQEEREILKEKAAQEEQKENSKK